MIRRYPKTIEILYQIDLYEIRLLGPAQVSDQCLTCRLYLANCIIYRAYIKEFIVIIFIQAVSFIL